VHKDFKLFLAPPSQSRSRSSVSSRGYGIRPHFILLQRTCHEETPGFVSRIYEIAIGGRSYLHWAYLRRGWGC